MAIKSDSDMYERFSLKYPIMMNYDRSATLIYAVLLFSVQTHCHADRSTSGNIDDNGKWLNNEIIRDTCMPKDHSGWGGTHIEKEEGKKSAGLYWLHFAEADVHEVLYMMTD